MGAIQNIGVMPQLKSFIERRQALGITDERNIRICRLSNTEASIFSS